MELNREQIKKELVLLIDDMPVELHLHRNRTSIFLSFLKLVLDIITTDEQKIFELENRLKECENGYEGTLYLERCKLHDAEEKVEELTEENERLRENNIFLNNTIGKNAQQALEVTLEETEKAKADTVRKMQERLTKEFDRMHKSNFITVEVRQWIIDQIAKEMLEGEK